MERKKEIGWREMKREQEGETEREQERIGKRE